VTQKAHSGSYLLRFPDRMGEIIERVVKACAPTPVTAKIRLGCSRDKINAIDVAQVVEGAGAAALTVHGRRPPTCSAAKPIGTRSARLSRT
jgi:tRNA-dihydrouridine synthase B